MLLLLFASSSSAPPSPSLSHCYFSMAGAWMTVCGAAHGWVAGIASHWSILLSRGWLTSMEAASHSGHPSSTLLLLQLLVFQQQKWALCIKHKTNVNLIAIKLHWPISTILNHIITDHYFSFPVSSGS